MKNELSEETKQSLEQMAQIGFAFASAIRAMPPELRIRFHPYSKGFPIIFKAKSLSTAVASVALAIARGYSAEERKEHLKKMKAERKAGEDIPKRIKNESLIKSRK